MFRRLFLYSKRFLALLVALAILATGLAIHSVAAQTIPTPTPTPVGGPATATRDPGPDPNPTAPPTSTSRPPQPTATSSRVPLPPTPEDGFLPTAQPCDPGVTARSLTSGLNVRSGPGLAYEIIDNLQLNEVRPVIGRVDFAAWWQILLVDGSEGWVADDLVDVSGYTGNLPLVESPPAAGVTVTPGTPWAPTPRPTCTPPPTSTTATTATATVTRDAPGTAGGVDAGAETLDGSETPAADEATATGTATPEPLPTEPPPTAAPLPDQADAGNGLGDLWAPLAGVALVLAAGALLILRRPRA